MNAFLETLAVMLFLLNFWLLGSSRLVACIRAVALQAVVLSAIACANHLHEADFRLVALLCVTIVIKAGVLPLLLRRATREVGAPRELDPIVGYNCSLLIGAALLGGCFLLSRVLHVPGNDSGWLLLVSAFFTIFSGLFLTVARKRAVTQVLGYMGMENGIYAFGMAFAIREPLLVEMGVLLDVLVAALVMGVAIFHISREFDHIDTDQLSTLKG